jgi:hypothetical protein
VIICFAALLLWCLLGRGINQVATDADVIYGEEKRRRSREAGKSGGGNRGNSRSDCRCLQSRMECGRLGFGKGEGMACLACAGMSFRLFLMTSLWTRVPSFRLSGIFPEVDA